MYIPSGIARQSGWKPSSSVCDAIPSKANTISRGCDNGDMQHHLSASPLRMGLPCNLLYLYSTIRQKRVVLELKTQPRELSIVGRFDSPYHLNASGVSSRWAKGLTSLHIPTDNALREQLLAGPDVERTMICSSANQVPVVSSLG